MSTDYVTVSPDQWEKMQKHLGGGIIGYLTRLRAGHRPMFEPGLHGGTIYTGCSCGGVPCSLPLLLTHIEHLKESYQAKVDDLAAETARSGGDDAAED